MILFCVGLCFSQNYQNIQEKVAVSVTGAGVNSATYQVTANQRVLDVVRLAFGGKLPSLSSFNSRAVLVTPPTSLVATDTLDLIRFIHTGDVEENPYVESGMQIHVPYSSHWVVVTGDLQGPVVGRIPLNTNETAQDILELFSLNPTADASEMLLESVNKESQKFSLLSANEKQLNHLDAITIFPKRDKKDVFNVLVKGEALRPGYYSIKNGVTTAQEILTKAGGVSKNGDEARVWVIRKTKQVDSKEFDSRKTPKTVKPEISNAVNQSALSSDYSIITLKSGDVVLEKGDELVIPLRESSVYVSGLVKYPGAYVWKEGENSDYYVNLAGGLTEEAFEEGVRVVEFYEDTYRNVDVENVLAGSKVLVPEKDKDRELRLRLQIWSTILQAFTATVTVATFIYTVGK
jgi:protein involved in polysaccharide export with SLBB domain